MTPLSWNRIPRLQAAQVLKLGREINSIESISSAPRPWIAYGQGRSYSDVCLNDRGTLLVTRQRDRFQSFDPSTGLLTCETGVTLQEILRTFVPKGWFLPVTPGTQYATLGGAIANDVHGKNHHVAGSFGHHVHNILLLRSNGESINCNQSENPELFRACIGGLGLTGLMLSATLRLIPIQSAWMRTQQYRFNNLNEFWTLSQELESVWPYSVSWIDCLAKGPSAGRGVLFLGKHADASPQKPPRQRHLSIPVDLPISVVNPLSLQLFNRLYFRLHSTKEETNSHYLPYFYPLDNIAHWNRLYGKKGFYQYQCVIPQQYAQDALPEILKLISQRRQGSFLAVLKRFGTQKPAGLMSFARPGTTLALDFPNHGTTTLDLFKSLDEIVKSAQGALYPAKDARMPASMFKTSFPTWEEFSNHIDPAFSSHFWRRVTS